MPTTLASGIRSAVRFTIEGSRGTTPAGITTAVQVSAAANGGATGLSKFTRASGDFVADGFASGQKVLVVGFTAPANNATWEVYSVTATDLVVIDASDVITDEAAGAGKNVQIQMQKLRLTGRNINLEKNILESAEVDADGQDTDVRHGFNRVVGSPGFQLSAQDYDTILRAALGGAWYAVTTTGTPNLAIDSSTKKITRASGSWITDGYRPGDRIRTTGFTNAANNTRWIVTAVTAADLTVSDPTGVIVTEASTTGRTVSYPGKRLDVSPTLITLVLERAFLDVGKYQVFNGVAVDQIGFNIQPEGIVGGTINLLGMSAVAIASSPLSSLTYLDPSGSSPYAAFDGALFEGGSINAVVTSVTGQLQRNRSLNPVVGSKFSPDVFDGQAKFDGKLSAYFQDETLLNKFINETESSLYIYLKDPNSNTEFTMLVFPRIKYVGGQMDPPQSGPVPVDMPFRALKKTGLALPGGLTTNTMFSIQRSNA